MTNRLLLDSSGLKLSRPGVNVLTAADIDLLFNSSSVSFNLYASGTTTISASSPSTVSFGKTFVDPPLVLAVFSMAGEYILPILAEWTPSAFFPTFSYEVWSNQVTFYLNTGSTGVSSSVVKYSIWELPI